MILKDPFGCSENEVSRYKCRDSTNPEASLVAQMVKSLPAVWETWVQFLGWENPLEKERATHSSTLVRKTPWTEEPGRLQSIESQRVGHESDFTHSLKT